MLISQHEKHISSLHEGYQIQYTSCITDSHHLHTHTHTYTHTHTHTDTQTQTHTHTHTHTQNAIKGYELTLVCSQCMYTSMIVIYLDSIHCVIYSAFILNCDRIWEKPPSTHKNRNWLFWLNMFSMTSWYGRQSLVSIVIIIL